MCPLGRQIFREVFSYHGRYLSKVLDYLKNSSETNVISTPVSDEFYRKVIFSYFLHHSAIVANLNYAHSGFNVKIFASVLEQIFHCDFESQEETAKNYNNYPGTLENKQKKYLFYACYDKL